MTRLATLLLWTTFVSCLAGQSPIDVAEGFKITKVADNQLATNIYSLTIDSHGQTVVAGPGYIKRLLDRDQDGIYDDFQLVSEFPKNGAQGLYFDGPTLYAIGDEGVLKLEDPNEDGFCDPPQVALKISTGGEHDAHAIRKGPNNHWYLLCGNGVPMPESEFQKTTLDKERVGNRNSGFLLELKEDFTLVDIVSQGFRNPYDFDFNSDSDVFTYDSDGERDISLPWYRPTRVYKLSRHSNAGWVSPSWKHPDYFNNMPATIGRHGRGSPTGVVCYRHDQFPKSYFDSVFVLDWTYGRIMVHQRDPSTGKYGPGSVFAKPRGTAAFAVTDAEVAPDGSLLVSVGGRGTEGAVYRIESTQATNRFLPKHHAQINSSWARYDRRKIKPEHNTWPATIDRLKDRETSIEEKLVELELACQQSHPPSDLFEQIETREIRLARKLVWAMNTGGGSLDQEKKLRIIEGAKGLRFGSNAMELLEMLDASAGIQHTAIIADFSPHFHNDSTTWDRTFFQMVSRFRSHVTGNQVSKRVRDKNWPPVFDGYTESEARSLPDLPVLSQIRNAIKVSEGITLYEWARRLAITRFSHPEIETLLLDQVTETSDPVEDIHYLICLARMMEDPKTSRLRRLVDGLMNARIKIEARELNVDKNWKIRMRELVSTLIGRFQIPEMIADHPSIAEPANFYLIESLPKGQKEIARMQIADFALLNPGSISAEQVSFLAAAESNVYCGLIRVFSDDHQLIDAVTSSLARNPIPEDRETFLQGFKSVNRRTWRYSAIGLRKLKSQAPEDAILVFNKARTLGQEKPDQRIASELFRFLVERYQKSTPAVKEFDLNQWRDFLSIQHPQEFSAANFKTSSVSQSLKRIEKIELGLGDESQGEVLFERLQCAQCHDGGNRLGPSLQGISNRFSGQDIMKAIVDPDAQIPARYRAEKILTADGEVIYGSIVYESTDGLVLTDRQNNTLRIDLHDVEDRATSDTSLMPSGLLDEISDQEVADLIRYVQSLK